MGDLITHFHYFLMLIKNVNEGKLLLKIKKITIKFNPNLTSYKK